MTRAAVLRLTWRGSHGEGDLLWEKTYGGGSSSFYSACRVGDGYVLTGKKESAGGGYDLYAVKTAEDGSLVWEKTVEGAGAGSGYAVAQSRGGGMIVTGKKGVEKSAASEILMLKLKSDSAQINSAFLYPAVIAVLVFAGFLFVFRKSLSKIRRSV